jgi:MoxR-like ATPase
MSPTYDRALVDATDADVVGRRREVELVVAALRSSRHVLLEGPPGTGKSTLLRSVAERGGVDLVFVEGNAELTPARLAGHFDPAQVLDRGYDPEVFVDGPLTRALRHGSLLYVEEINRVPEETLNLLVTVMSEGELTVPRLGRVGAEPGFRMVAAMNPFDAVGTARISGAIYDRVCRVAVGYQERAVEEEVVRRAAPGAGDELVRRAVDVVRRSRDHGDIRIGSSVRGAIDLVLLAAELSVLRDSGGAESGDAEGRDAARASLSGRIRVLESSHRTAEDIVDELWDASAPQPEGDPSDSGDPDGGGDPKA